MLQISPSCNRIGVLQKCIHCQCSNVVKSGRTSDGKQRFRCKVCRRKFIATYTYVAYYTCTNSNIVKLLKEGVGIRGTARLLKISATTVLARLLRIAKYIQLPAIVKNSTYEVDELRTFIKRKDKLVWVVYALER